MTLQNLPLPGLAVVPKWQAQEAKTIKFHCGSWSSSPKIYNADGTLLFSVDCSQWSSMSGRKTIMDSTGNAVGQVRRNVKSMKYQYYFQTLDSEQHLWDFTSKACSSRHMEITLRNAVNYGNEVVLKYDDSWSGRKGGLFWGNQLVASIEAARSWKGTADVEIEVAAGMDLVLVVGIYLAVRAMHQSKNNIVILS